MNNTGRLVHLLRNITARELIRAIERDGFLLRRNTQTGGMVYGHPDGRNTLIHFHAGRHTIARKTLASIIRAVQWTEADLRRLGLI